MSENNVNIYKNISTKYNVLDELPYSDDWLNETINRLEQSEDVPPTELNIAYTSFECLVGLLAIIGNAMVIIVFQKERRLRRRTNYYIVSLAIADLLVGLLGVPFAILASIGLPTNLHACLFSLSLLVVLCTISIFCLVAVSVDRYWAILHPMAYSRNVRTKTAIVIIALCYLAGCIVGFLPLFGWHAAVSNENQPCLFVEVMDYNYLVFLYFATIITPAIILVAFYAHIYRVIIKQVRQIVTMNPVGQNSRRSSSATKSNSNNNNNNNNNQRPTRHQGGTMLRVLGAAQKREVKATQNLSIIVLFFMICWIPLYTINCVKAFCPDCYVHPKLTFFCIILSHLNSAVNPLLYAYHLRDFRAALKSFIMKLFGAESQPNPELNYRLSLANQQQQRLQSMIEKRASLQPRIYIDSPIWLRSQQNGESPPRNGSTIITRSLNGLHQTVTAVASVTTDPNREMWRIVEVPSAAEESSRNMTIDNSDIDIQIRTKHRDSITSSSDSGKETSFENNKEYSNNYYDDDEDDDVFMSPTSSEPKLDNYTEHVVNDIAFSYNINSNSFESTDYFSTELPFYEDSIKNDESLTSISKTLHSCNTDNDLSSVPSCAIKNSLRKKLNNNENSNNESDENFTELNETPKIFFIEKDTEQISPSKPTPKIVSTTTKKNGINNNKHNNINKKTNNNNEKNTGAFRRSRSETIHKSSPLRVVSNLIFPPNTHSSLFHIFDRQKNNHTNKSVNKLKRTLSDS